MNTRQKRIRLFGKAILLFLFISFSSHLKAQHGWDFYENQYSLDGEIAVAIDMGSVRVTKGTLGAFVGDSCRGIADADLFPINDSTIFSIRIYSDTPGETISFKYYNPDDGLTYDIEETHAFDSNDTPQGLTPYIYHVSLNDPPVVSDIPNQTVLEDAGFATINLDDFVADPDNLDSELTWTATGQSALTVVIDGSRVATITAPADWVGFETITFTAEDTNAETDSDEVTFTATAVNDAPGFTAGGDDTALEDEGIQTVAWATDLSTGPSDESWQTLTFNVSNDDNALFSVQPAISPAGILTYTPASDANGSAEVTVSLSDNGGVANSGEDTSPDQTFTISLTPVNDVPSFTAGSNENVDEDAPPQTVPGWATLISPGPADEAGQTLTFTVTNSNNSLFSAQPAVSADGTLTYTTALNQSGSATVNIRISDDGGTTNGGVDESADQVFTINVSSDNDPPVVTDIPDQTISEGNTFTQINLNSYVSDTEDPDNLISWEATGQEDLTVTISLGIATITLPDSDWNGTETILFTAEDQGTLEDGNSASFTVTPINDEPGFTKGSDQIVNEDAGAVTIADWATGITAGAANESGQTLSFAASNNNFGLFAVEPAISPAGTLTFTPAANANGFATVTVRISDDGGTDNGGDDTSPDQSFTITVNPVNDVPSFTAGADQSALEDAGSQTVVSWASGISTGPTDESGQAVTFNVTNDNNSLFSAQPTIAAGGALSYTPAPDANGSALITVTISDDGGTANGGVNLSESQAFNISITPVNDEPGFTKGANEIILEDAGPQTVSNWATSISEGPANESSQTVSFNVSNDNFSLFTAQPTISPTGTLTYTPADNAVGTAVVTVSINDNGGDANGGVNISGDQTFEIEVTPVNDAPGFIPGGTQTVNEDAGGQIVSWASAISPGPADESGQTLTFNVSNSNNALFSAQPAIASNGVLTYTPADNAFGSATVNVSLSDNGGTANSGVDESATVFFTINVTAVNDAPVVGDIPDQTINEGALFLDINLNDYVSDVESTDNEIFWTTLGDDDLDISILNGIATISISDINWNGSESIMFTAHDGGGAQHNNGATFTVSPVNDVPGFTAGANQTRGEDSGPYSTAWATGLTAGPSNESSQSLSFNVSNDSPGLFSSQPVITPLGLLSFTPAPNANGIANVTVSISDDGGTANGGDDTSPDQSFTIEITPVNDPPVVSNIPDQTINEGESFTSILLNNFVSDIESADSEITWSTTGDTELSVSITNNIATIIIPDPDWYGSQDITFTARDQDGLEDFDNAVFTVNPVNDEPGFDVGLNQDILEDAGAQSIPGWATAISAGPANEDSQTLTFNLSNNNNALFSVQPVVASNGTLSYTPAPNANGSALVTVNLSDNGGTANGGDNVSGNQTFSIIVAPVNDAPGFTSGSNQSVAEDSPGQSVPWATGISPGPANESSQTVGFNVSNDSPGMFSIQPAIAANGSLSYTPAPDAFGVATVTVSATDNGGTTDGGDDTSDDQIFTITLTPVNDGPEVSDIPNQTINEGAVLSTINLDNYVTDIDNTPEQIAWTASGQSDLTVSITDRIATIIRPDLDWNGSETITFRAQDGGSLFDTDDVIITVVPVNDEPTFVGGSNVTVFEDAPAQNLSAWATSISAGPDDEDAQILTFSVSNDNNTLFSAQPQLTSDGTLTFTPAPNTNGSALVTVRLGDNGGIANGGDNTSGDHTFTIFVTSVNDEPGFTGGSDVTVSEDAGLQTETSWATAITAGTNEATQTLSFNVTTGNDGLFSTLPSISAAGTLTFTPAANAFGSAVVTVSLSDNGGTANGGDDTSPDQTFTIFVTSVNDEPGFIAGSNQSVSEDAGSQTVAAWASGLSTGPANESAQTLTFVVSNDNSALFSVEPAIASNGTLSYTPASNVNGTASVTVFVRDNGGTANGGDDTSDPQVFSIAVTSVNDEPGFTSGSNESILEDAGAQTVAAWASNISPGPSNETSQTLTFNVSNNNSALFSVEPSLAANGTLSYTPADDANGSATITVSLSDNGGVADGGDDTSPDQTFTINITPVNDAPGFVAGGNQSVAEDAPPQSIAAWATSILAGPTDETGQSLTFNVSNDNNPLFSSQPAVAANGTLTYTPAANASGSATVTVSLTDNGGTANGGVATSADQIFIINVSSDNDPPVVTDIPDQTRNEGDVFATITLDNFVSDTEDGDEEIEWTFSGQTELTVTIADRIATIAMPDSDWFGVETITFFAEDLGGAENSNSATFTVNAINDEPGFTPGANQVVAEDAIAQSIPAWASAISAGPANESGQTLTFNVSSTNSSLFTVEPAISSTGTLTYTPVPDAHGSATVTVSLSDDGGTALGGDDQSDEVSFTITVNSVNDVPVFTAGTDQTVLEDAAAQTVAAWATDISAGPANESGQVLNFIVSNDNNSLFSVQPAISATGNLTYTPAPDANGIATLTVSLHDDGGTSNSGVDTSDPEQFTITLTAVNDVPEFTAGLDQAVSEDAGAQSLTNWASAISTGPANESSQTLTFNVSNDNNPMFSAQPSISANGTLTYTPAANAFGSATVTVSLSDDGGTDNGGVDTSPDQTFTIDVSAVNDPPVISNIPDQTINEGSVFTSIQLDDFVSDVEDNDNQIIWNFTGNTALGVSIEARVATITIPDTDWNGSETITFTARDSEGDEDTDNVQFTVASVNDEPTFTGGENQTILEDEGAQVVAAWATDISAGPSDEDSQVLAFNVSNSNTSLFSVQPVIAPDGTLTYTPAANAFGSALVTVRLGDSGGTARGGDNTSGDQTFTISITSVNDAPLFTAGSDQSIQEDANAQTISGWATGISAGPANEAGQSVTFNVSNNNSSLFTTQPNVAPNGTLTYTPAANANGLATVTVSARDNGGTTDGGDDTSDDQTFTITISAVNDGPAVSDIPDQNVNEGASFASINLDAYLTDLDNTPEQITWTATGQSELTIDITDRVVTIIPPDSDWNGSETITFTASDPDGLTDSDEATFSAVAINDAPSFTGGSDVTVLEDIGAQTITAWATDITTGPDNESTQTLFFNVSNGNNSLFSAQPEIATDGTLTFTPAADANGSALVTVSLSDNGGTANGGNNTSSDQTFTINVTPVNDEPGFTAGPNQIRLEDAGPQVEANWATAISAGPDNESTQTLTFFVSNNNNSLFSVQPTIASNGTLSYTPADNAHGTATVTVSLNDNGGTANGGDNFSDDQNFAITLVSVNDAPVLDNPIDDQEEDEYFGSITISLIGVFSDADGTTPTLTTSSDDPAVVTVSISGTDLIITETGLGTATVTVTANDGTEVVHDNFLMTVNNVNDPPEVANQLDDLDLDEHFGSEFVNLNNLFSDKDEDTLILSAVSNNTGIVSVSISGTILTINEEGLGSATITVTADDGEFTASDAFIVTVNNVNDPPEVVNSISNIVRNEYFVTQDIDISNVFTDPDGTTPVLSATSSDTDVATVSVSAGTLTVTEIGLGVSTITVSAYDGEYTETDIFTFTINNVNETPVVDNPIVDRPIDEGFGSFTIDLSSVFSDPDVGDVLDFTATSSANGVVSVSVTDNIMTVTEEGIGSSDITVSANDGEFLVSDVFRVIVNNVNLAPVFTCPSVPTYLTEGFGTHNISLSDLVTDPDGDPLTINSTSSDNSVVTVDNNSTTLTITEVGNGSSTINIFAFDGIETRNCNFTVIVNNVNDAPQVVNPIPDRAIDENFNSYTLNLTSVFNDPDSDPLTFSAVSSNTGIATVSVNGVTLTVTEQGIGTTNITVTASDDEYDTDDVFELEIIGVNESPLVVNPIADQNLLEHFTEGTIELANVFTDPDGDALILSVTSSDPGVASASISGSTLTLTEAGLGSTNITVTADDGEYDVFDLFEVTVTNVNDPPLVNNEISDLDLDEGFGTEIINLTNVFTDPDDDNLSYTAVSSDDAVVSVTIAGNTLVITETGLGTANITVTARDAQYPVDDVFVVNVNNLNDPPVVVVPIQNRNVLEGFVEDILNISGVFEDPDGDNLTYTAVSSEEGVVTVSMNGTTLTITEVGNGSSNITITANDSEFDTDTNFGVTVQDVNDPPVLDNPIDDQILEEHFEAHYIDLTGVFSDPDSEDLGITAISDNEDVVSVLVTNNTLTIVEADTGITRIRVIASDGTLTAADTFMVTVNNVNDAPVVENPIDTLTYDEGFSSDVLDLSTVFVDPDNDPLAYSIVSNSNQDVISIELNGTSLIIGEVGLGTSAVTVAASDGIYSTDETFYVTVNNVNDAPHVVRPIDDQEYVVTFGNQTLLLTTVFGDVDGDTLSMTAVSSNEDVVKVEVNGVTLNITVNGLGSADITVTASDSEFSVDDLFVIDVIPENDLIVSYLDLPLSNGDTITVLNEDNSVDLRIDSDVSWGFIENIFWLTPTMVGDSILTLDYKKNAANEPRKGTITIQDNQSHKILLHIYQTIGTTILEWTKSELKIYPNPVEDNLNIQLNLEESGEVLIEVLDPQGRLMEQREVYFYGNDLIQLDVSHYTEGLYFVRISDKSRMSIKKIIKQ